MSRNKINQAINQAKEVIIGLLESDGVVYTEQHQLTTLTGEIVEASAPYEYTFSELMYVYPQKAVLMLRSLICGKHTLSIQTRIALAALLKTSVFKNESRHVGVYFGDADWYHGNKESIVALYKQCEKHWGEFDIYIQFSQDPMGYDLEENETPHKISLMTGRFVE